MTDPRTRFRTLDALGPPPDVWARAVLRGPQQPHEPPPPIARRIGTAILALGIAAAAIGFAVSRFGEEVPPASPREEIASIARRIPVAVPNQVIAGFGSIWAGAGNADGTDGGEVLRIDPVTAQITARIPVRELPTWEVGTAGMAIGRGYVWIAGSRGVERIDPVTQEVTTLSFETGGLLADVWVDDSGVWVLAFGPSGGDPLSVARLDPESGSVMWVSDVPLRWGQSLFRAGGSLWAYGDGVTNRGGISPDTLVEIDPVSGSVGRQRSSSCEVVPSSGGRLWIEQDGAFGLLDPSIDAFSPVDLADEEACGRSPVSDGVGGVWLVPMFAGDPSTEVTHISSQAKVDRVATIVTSDLGGWQAATYDATTDTIWLANFRAFLLQVAFVQADQPEVTLEDVERAREALAEVAARPSATQDELREAEFRAWRTLVEYCSAKPSDPVCE